MSQLRDDIASDFLLVDELEPITWRRFDDDGNVINNTAVTYALRRAAKKDLLFSERLVTGNDRVIVASEVVKWHFQVSAVAPQVPRKGDLIIDGDGVVWAIWEVTTETFRTRYKCVCTRHSALP